jgi:carboxyl-terminal processing protease
MMLIVATSEPLRQFSTEASELKREYKSVWKTCCVLLVLWQTNAFAGSRTPAAAKLSSSERALVASRIYSLLGQYFSGWSSLQELNFDIAYRNYLEKALSSEDPREFDLAAMKFVARLKNGHTLFRDSWLTQNYGQSLGFYSRALDREWVVETSSVPTLKPGDVLSKIDDTEEEAYFQQQRKYISGSNEAAQRHNFFLLPYLFPLQFTITLGDGRKVNIDRSVNKPLPPTSRVDARWVAQNTIAYVQIDSFASPLAEEKALSLIDQFKAARTLIIDVRSNAGGLVPRNLIKALMDRTYRDWRQSTPVHISALELADKINKGGQQSNMPDFEKGYLAASAAIFGGSELSWGGELVPPDKPVFHGQIILLVDGGCASACEAFVGPFQNNRRATLVGETTEGTAGPVFMVDLGDGMQLGIAATRQYFPDGTEFEGVGIKPDVEVHPSIDDLKNGRDAILNKAIEIATTASK